MNPPISTTELPRAVKERMLVVEMDKLVDITSSVRITLLA
jgi:hypothetical protein